MTAKEYLSQAHRLNERINSDLAELDSLRNLAVSISGGSFGERVQHSRDADPPYVKAVMKICDMEQKINTEIDRLIDLKSEISTAIGCLTNMDEQMLLRYTTQTYAIQYSANGGTGAPSTHYKTYGETAYISSTKPSKANASAGSYTVTLNANGGTCSTASLSAARTTKYSFSKWNTNSSGSGTNYNSGQSYTTNAALYLYAIYTSSTTTAAVTLPTPTRSGYDFLGWATSSTASSGTTGSYTPTGNVTLYATWGSKGLVYIDSGSAYVGYQIYIDNGSGWDLYAPYIDNGSSWDLYS